MFADNCNENTISFLEERHIRYEKTSLGNGGYLYMCNYIFDHCSDDDYVYLLEDDYIHRSGSRQRLEEGLKIADYVTLFCH